MMKRKLSAMLLILALLISACAAPAQNEEKQSPHKRTEPAPSAVQAEEAAPAADPTEEAAPAMPGEAESEPGAPLIVMGTSSRSRYNYDSGVCFGTCSIPIVYCGRLLGAEQQQPVEDDADYPALAAALRAYSEESEKSLDETFNTLVEYAQGDYKNGNYPGAEDSRWAYASLSTPWLVRSDEKLVSFCVENYSFAGGAHPYTSYTGVNFDSETGERLALTDLLTEKGRQIFPELFEAALAEQYPDFMRGLLVDSVQEAIREEISEGLLYFVLDDQGMTVLINPYDLAAYASGPAFVRLYFEDYPDVFEKKYCTTRDEWTRQLRPQNESSAYSMLNTVRYMSDGRERELKIDFSPDEYGYGPVAVTLDGRTWTDPENYCYAVTPVLMHAEGRDLLYLEYRMGNDWAKISVLDLSGEEPRLLGELSEGFYVQMPTDVNSFYLISRSGCMSTYAVSRRYAVSADGTPVPLEELYTALDKIVLTLRVDMDMTLLSGNGEGRTVSVPAGESLTIYRTNNKDLVDLISQTGEIYRVSYDRGDDYMGVVNGVPLAEAFDGVKFAG